MYTYSMKALSALWKRFV